MGDFNRSNGSILVCLDFESPSYGVSVLLGVELGLAAYAVLVNSFVIYLYATKVKFHPLVLAVSILERFYAALDCGTEVLKSVFFLTSCQPNWTMVLPLSVTKSYNKSDVNRFLCSAISVLTSHFNFSALTFFVVTTIVRFYILIVKNPLPTRHQSGVEIAMAWFTIGGAFAWNLLWTWVLVQNHNLFAFTRACLSPSDEAVWAPNIYGFLFYNMTFIQYTVALGLNIGMVWKVIKATTGSTIRGSRGFLQNMTARHLSIFSYSISQIIVTLSALILGPGSTWLLKKMVVGSEGPFTNTHRSIILSFAMVIIHGLISPTMGIVCSDECRSCCKAIFRSLSSSCLALFKRRSLNQRDLNYKQSLKRENSEEVLRSLPNIQLSRVSTVATSLPRSSLEEAYSDEFLGSLAQTTVDERLTGRLSSCCELRAEQAPTTLQEDSEIAIPKKASSENDIATLGRNSKLLIVQPWKPSICSEESSQFAALPDQRQQDPR